MALTLVPEAIEAYAEAHTEPVSPLFDALREETYAQMQSPQMQVGRLEGSFLRLLVRISRAKRVLEIGMFTGYSALMMADPHGRKITIRMGPALETIRTLKGPIDMVFIDADKENYSRYYDAVLPLLKTGGLIVADNVLWSGRVLKPEQETDRAIVAFNEKVAKDGRVEKVLLTIRDGMMLAYKK